MTISEAEKFYAQDKKEYQLEENSEFINWLNDSIKNGYNFNYSVLTLQKLIDTLVNWYEIKYPERELEEKEGIRYIGFNNIKKLSKHMNFKELLYRLPSSLLSILLCNYRAYSGSVRYKYDKDHKAINCISIIGIKINRKNVVFNPYDMNSEFPYFFIYANSSTGLIEKDMDLEKYIDNLDNTNKHLNELLEIFREKYNEELEYVELEACIYNHECDIALRNKLLSYVALKLLYSKNTVPERGYIRAKKFIKEINKELGIDLETYAITELMNKGYEEDLIRERKLTK